MKKITILLTVLLTITTLQANANIHKSDEGGGIICYYLADSNNTKREYRQSYKDLKRDLERYDRYKKVK